MLKTAIISNEKAHDFVANVNDFIKDKKVIDIKYQSYSFVSSYNINGTPDELTIVDRALVIYEVEDEPQEELNASN